MKRIKLRLMELIGLPLLLLAVAPINYAQNPVVTTIPVFSSDKEKADWIEKNPDVYRSAGGQLEIKSARIEKTEPSRNPVKEVVIFENDPTFPTYVVTGNEENDNATYDSKKQLWIQNNQAKYNSMVPANEEGNLSREERLKKYNIVEPK